VLNAVERSTRDHADLCNVHRLKGRCFTDLGYHHLAIPEYRKALNRTDDAGEKAKLLVNLALSHLFLGNYEEALACADRVEYVIGSATSKKAKAFCSYVRGRARIESHRFRQTPIEADACESLRRAVDLFRESEFEGHANWTQVFLGLSLVLTGQDGGMEQIEAARLAGRRSRDWQTEGWALWALAFVGSQALPDKAALIKAAQAIAFEHGELELQIETCLLEAQRMRNFEEAGYGNYPLKEWERIMRPFGNRMRSLPFEAPVLRELTEIVSTRSRRGKAVGWLAVVLLIVAIICGSGVRSAPQLDDELVAKSCRRSPSDATLLAKSCGRIQRAIDRA
jgi:tetratricopeptide (TPR) repeat protein